MNDHTPTGLLVKAQIRCAAREGIPMIVRQSGDDSSGVICLKINLLNGTSRILTQVRVHDELVWMPASDTETMPESQAEEYVRSQQAIDPDAWIIEIEDKQGRLWFPGRLLDSEIF